VKTMRPLFRALQLEWALEFRQKSALLAGLLFVAGSAFLASKTYLAPPPSKAWNALLWIVLLFSALHAATRSFAGVPAARWWLVGQWMTPVTWLWAKGIVTAFQLVVLGVFSLALFSFLLGLPVGNPFGFLLVVVLGSAGLSGVLTTTAALAAQVDARASLMAVLSIPLLLPTLATIQRAALLATAGVSTVDLLAPLGSVALLAGVPVVLGTLLFPYLWKP
jgi:heme exporter protein B